MKKAWIIFLILLGHLRVVQALPSYEGELTPDKAVALALKYSPEPALARFQLALQSAEKDKVASESSLKLVLGMLAAQQNNSMIYATGGEPNFLQTLPGATTGNLNLMAMLPLYNGGLLRYRLAAAEKSERAAEARQEVALRRTVLEARRAYFEVYQANAELVARTQELEARQELLAQAQKRFKVGKEARFVVLRAEAEVSGAQQQLNNARSQQVQKEAQLKSMLGLSWESRFQYPESDVMPEAPDKLEQSLQLARKQRPELVAARFAVEEGDQRLLASLADYAPKLNMVAMADTAVVSGGQWSSGYSIGFALSFPLYDGGQRQAQERAALVEIELRKAQIDQLELAIERDVASAQSGLSVAIDNAQLSQIELDKAIEELRISRLRFDLGRALYLELIDSLALLSRARSNRLNALFEAHRKEAEYCYAIGRFP